MTAIAITDLSKPRDPDAPRWVGIGGGDLPAILGWSTRATPWTLYQRKIGALARDPDNAFMADGRRMEAVMAEWWHERHGRHGLALVDPHRIYRHPAHEWAVGAVDRLVVPEGHDLDLDRPWWPTMEVWEAKSVYDPDKGRDIMRGEVPPDFWVQIQWYLELMDVDRARFVAKVGPQYVEQEVGRDREAAQWLLTCAAEMWRRIEERDPPPLGVGKPLVDAKAVARMFPDADNTETKVLSRTAAEAVETYRQLRALRRDINDAMAASRAVIELELGRAGVGTAEDGTPLVTWRQARPTTTFDPVLWAARAPKQARGAMGRYRRTTPGSRRLVVMDPEGAQDPEHDEPGE